MSNGKTPLWPDIDQIGWNHIFNSIANSKTILFIGPSIATDNNGKSLQRAFFERFYSDHKDKIISYHERDEFFIFDENHEMTLRTEIGNFYKQNFAENVYTLITQIPFHLIIQVSPVITLRRIFNGAGYSCNYNYFDYKIARKIDTPPTRKCPLIYDLFGSADDPGTQILTHSDMFSYLKKYYEQTLINQELLKVIREQFDAGYANNILFIGMDFDKWYMQWILHELQINVAKIQRYALFCSSSDENKTLIENKYRITFVNDKISQFFLEIKNHFEKTCNAMGDEFEKYQLRQPEPTAMEYDTEKISKFLYESFSADEIDFLCMTTFSKVYSTFSSSMSNISKIGLLIIHVEKHLEIKKLLDRTFEMNPSAFDNSKPFTK